jgi:hypothetical protein
VESVVPSDGKVEEWCWEAITYKVVALPMSVKDRWVGPRERVLNVLILCR